MDWVSPPPSPTAAPRCCCPRSRSTSASTSSTSPYPYREIEYAYPYGQPPADSLTASFLTYLTHGGGQAIICTHGHLPCATPKGLKICGEG